MNCVVLSECPSTVNGEELDLPMKKGPNCILLDPFVFFMVVVEDPGSIP
jgi:hypothetical protein